MTESGKNREALLKELRALVDGERKATAIWADALPALRAQAGASAAVYSEIAHGAPFDAKHEKSVDVLLSGPDQEWAAKVVLALRGVLPDWTEPTDFMQWRWRDFDPVAWPFGVVWRVPIRVRSKDGLSPRERVVGALLLNPTLSVNYSEPLDLVVVAPVVPVASGGES